MTSSQAGSMASDLAKKIPIVGIKMAVAVLGAVPIMAIYPFIRNIL